MDNNRLKVIVEFDGDKCTVTATGRADGMHTVYAFGNLAYKFIEMLSNSPDVEKVDVVTMFKASVDTAALIRRKHNVKK